jgi:hypothetical protein
LTAPFQPAAVSSPATRAATSALRATSTASCQGSGLPVPVPVLVAPTADTAGLGSAGGVGGASE